VDQAHPALSVHSRKVALAGCVLAWLASACGGSSSADGDAAPPYASEVISFEPGENGGYGMKDFPDVVLGPPRGKGTGAGSLDVLSLGVGGEIVLGFGEREIEDGPGPDFIVFENVFWANGDPDQAFIEPGEVAVSDDGDHWQTFPCDPQAGREDTGCAGLHPTLVYDTDGSDPLDPDQTGGDAFDLSAVQLRTARYVRIRDLSDDGEGTTGGFDLDAVGLVNYTSR
jgi:hypothetical protein